MVHGRMIMLITGAAAGCQGALDPSGWPRDNGRAVAQDEFELWFDKGVTDGLPVVPPTPERVERGLAGTRRDRDGAGGLAPPHRDYPPVVRAAVEAACAPVFTLHGLQATTHFAAPLIVINGPIRSRIGLNAGFGVFGPGFRANATIGRGPPPEAGRVPPLPAEAPHGTPAHASRTAKSLAGSLGWSMACLWNAKHFPLYSQTMLVVGPEHAPTFAEEGWAKADLKRFLVEPIRRPYRELLPDEESGEGTNLRFTDTPPEPDELVPKFAAAEELHVGVAGGTAGRFSVAIPGWLGARNGSRAVTKRIGNRA